MVIEEQVFNTQELCNEKYINIQVLNSESKRIDLAILKMRNDMSRLGRRTLCTTKRPIGKNHLDL